MSNHGKKSQVAAIDHCRKLNAGLPLPKSKSEAYVFAIKTGKEANIKDPGMGSWMGITDSTKSGNKAAWKDLEGNPIGNRFVNIRVKR